jgi:hypothetical protein
VLAVPDKIVEEQKTPENLAQLLDRRNEQKLPPGVVIHSTGGTIRDLPENDPRKKVEQLITITADEKAGVNFTAVEQPAAPSQKSSSEASPPSATMFAGIALAGAIVSGGLWFWRRKETA